MPEIPLKISRAIIRKKARELRHNNFMGQGEGVLCNFAECAPMPKGIEGIPRLNSYIYIYIRVFFLTEIFEFWRPGTCLFLTGKIVQLFR